MQGQIENWHIYFIQGDKSKRVKIGIAVCPRVRKKQIQSHSTEKLDIIGVITLGECTRADATKRELEVQTQFRHSHAYAEIFDISAELSDFIEKNGTTHACDNCPKDERVLGPWDRHASNKGKPWSRREMLYPRIRNKKAQT